MRDRRPKLIVFYHSGCDPEMLSLVWIAAAVTSICRRVKDGGSIRHLRLVPAHCVYVQKKAIPASFHESPVCRLIFLLPMPPQTQPAEGSGVGDRPVAARSDICSKTACVLAALGRWPLWGHPTAGRLPRSPVWQHVVALTSQQ